MAQAFKEKTWSHYVLSARGPAGWKDNKYESKRIQVETDLVLLKRSLYMSLN